MEQEMKSETKFTPGPWKQRGDCVYSAGVRRGNICAVSDLKASSVVRYSPLELDSEFLAEGYANAALIASAPKLYEELSHLVRLMEPLERDGKLNIPGLATLNGARAALAAALGRTP